MDQTAIACPGCRGTNRTQIAAKSGYSFTRGPDGEDRRIPQTMFVFQCQCGVAFTHTVRGEPVDREASLLAGQPDGMDATNSQRPTPGGFPSCGYASKITIAMHSDFWLHLHGLAESIRTEGSDRSARQAALRDSFETLAPLARYEVARDYRLVVSELAAFEPQFLTLSLTLAAVDEKAAHGSPIASGPSLPDAYIQRDGPRPGS